MCETLKLRVQTVRQTNVTLVPVSCVFSHILPGGSSDKISIQQPELAEQNSVDKGNSGQLLQSQMGLELKFLLFHEERHSFTVFTSIKKNTTITIRGTDQKTIKT